MNRNLRIDYHYAMRVIAGKNPRSSNIIGVEEQIKSVPSWTLLKELVWVIREER